MKLTMKYIPTLFLVCTLVCAVMSAQIDKDIENLLKEKARQGGDDGEKSLLRFLKTQAQADNEDFDDNKYDSKPVKQGDSEADNGAKAQWLHFHFHWLKKLLNTLEAQKEDNGVEQEEGDNGAKAQWLHFHFHWLKKLLNTLEAQKEDNGVEQVEGDNGAKAQYHLQVHHSKKARSLLNKLKALRLEEKLFNDAIQQEEGDDGAS